MELSASQQRVGWVVALYWAVSISLVFVNKVVMTTKGVSIPAPLFITWFQCVFTAALCYLMGYLSRPGASLLSPGQFPQQSFDLATALKVAPLSLIFVGMITFNNMCLMYVEVSFYNVARSLTICFNVVLTYALLGSRTSGKTMAALVLVILGFYIGSEGEVNFSLVGTVFGVVSSVFVSLNSIYTKKVLPHVGEDKWVLAFYNNVNASIIFLPCMLFAGEFSVLSANIPTLMSAPFWAGMLLSGVLGFSIGIVVVMQIKATSPLTHNVSGTAKACAQTMLAFFLWGNEMTAGAVAGVALVLGGSLLYAYIRISEENDAKAKPAPVPLDASDDHESA